jgi:hypothetical protein
MGATPPSFGSARVSTLTGTRSGSTSLSIATGAIALGRLVGTARRTRLEFSDERAWAATFRQGKLVSMTIHEDWSTAIDWLNSRETDAEETR